MAKKHPRAYPLEFRAQIVELARAGRRPENLAVEFELSNQTIRNWIKQADLDVGKRTDGLTSEERPSSLRCVRKCSSSRFAFGSRCREANFRPSMGSVGDCYDNAMCESFNVTLECELLEKHRFRTHFRTHKEAELALAHPTCLKPLLGDV